MNKRTIKLFSLIFFIILSLNLIGASPFRELLKKDETLIVLDSSSNTGLPDKFRDITNLNISGSAQFTKNQIENLKNSINKPKICIVDLRQESHGLINNFAISFFNRDKILNNGFTTKETVDEENSELSSIKIGSPLNIYHKTGRIFKEIITEFISNEESVVTNAGIEYKRYAVLDNNIPTIKVVDDFVEFIKNKPDDLHLHFHCDAGEGRTTTFMSMYQIMMNNSTLSLNQILSYQYNIGGLNLINNKNKYEFLEEFYNYVQANKDDNYSISYKEWIKK